MKRSGSPQFIIKFGKGTRLTLAFVTVLIVTSIIFVSGLAQNASRVSENNLKPVKQATLSNKQGVAVRESAEINAPGQQPNVVDAANNYAFATTTTGTFTNMTGSAQLVGAAADDTASTVTNLPFDFYFLGTRYTQFSASSNGYIRLGSTAVSTTQYTLGTANVPLIAALGSDLFTAASVGKVHYKTTGSAPNRVLTVEFLNETIIYDGAGATSDGTYQVRLYETSGVIEFVYGSMNRNSSTGFQGGLDAQYIGFSINSTANNFYSVDTTGTASTTTLSANQFTMSAPMASLNSPTDGARRTYSFTPTTPTAPTNLTFSAVTPTSITLNWTDSANETLYAIYRSTDGTNYSFVNTAAQNATSLAAIGLTPSTTYFWQVYSVSDGAFSSALSGSQATAAPGVVMSTAAGGPWSSTATWVGGVVPTANDDVTIVDGATVTIDTAAVALDVFVGTGGAAATLTWDSTTARTLTVGVNVTIASNGTFATPAAGTVITHVLSVGGNLTNNGVLDFSTNTNTAGAGITFTTATSNTFGGTGATTDIRTLTINKGTSNANILELNPTNFTVQGVTTDVAGFLTLTNGTFKVSGTFTITNRVFTAAGYSIGAATGFWLNNPNFTVVGQNGSPTVAGMFRVSQGTYNIGTSSGNSMGFSTGSNITVEGGAINATGRFGVASATNAITYTQSAGTITVCTVGNTSTTLGSFDLGTSASSTITMSGGTIVVQLASSGIDYRYDSGGSLSGLTGGTVQFGNASSGAAKTFSARGVAFNYVVNTTSAGHTVNLSTTLVNWNHVAFGINIGTGGTFGCGNSIFFIEGNVVNNGTLTATSASVRLYNAATSAQTYSGSGIFTAPITSFELDNSSGLSISTTNQLPVARVILFSGSITGSNKITLGNGGATTGTIQIGNTTTPTDAGTFDVPLTFNLGTGGEVISYLRTTASRTTGGEINPTRTLTTLTYDDNDTSHTLTIAGGDLTVTGTTALTNGRVITGSNTLIVGSAGTVTRTTGYVDGNLRKTYTANGAKTFEVGTANGYSPVTATVSAGTGPLTVRANQGPQPNLAGPNALQRYWTLTGPGLTADLTFKYLSTDPVGNEAAYHVFRYNGSFTDLGGTINTAGDTASVTGVSSLNGDWTAAEPGSEALSSMSINDVSSVEADAGTHSVTFTVNLSQASGQTVTANWSTTQGSAQSNADFVPSSGMVSISPGMTSGTFTVPVVGDILDEANESFFVNLTSPSNATISDATGACTIIDDDINSGDFDGDGINDASVFRPNPDGTHAAKWYLLHSSGNGVVSGGVSFTEIQFGADTDIPAAGDYDGNGTKDVAVFRPNDDGSGNSAFYVSHGSPNDFDKYVWGLNGDKPVPGDYDGDLKTDVAVFRPSDGNWYIRKSSDGSLLVQQWGLATDRLVPADYDADGKTDLAVFRSDDPVAGSGMWYILRSSDGGFSAIQWGLNTDKVVPADYDVDGKADIAVWRPSNSTWYIRRSSNGSLQAVTFGAMGDLPVPGDYDGDSKADIAVWRPSDGTYYFVRSSDGSISYGPQWGQDGDMPVAARYVPEQ